MTVEDFYSELTALAERYLGSLNTEHVKLAFWEEGWKIVQRLYDSGGGLYCRNQRKIEICDLDLVVVSDGRKLTLTATRRQDNVTRH